MHLIFSFQASVGAMDVTQWSFNLSLCSNYEVLICYDPQNGRRWVASNVLIAQPVLAQSCELILELLELSSAHFCSALAAAYPDDVDERFAGHWYSRPCCALALLLLTSP
jgi:hypothetical protein